MKAFINRTSSNGKFQIKTNIELSGKGVRKFSNADNVYVNSELHTGLNMYWVTELALIQIEKNIQLVNFHN